MAVIELDLDTLTARQIAKRIATELKVGKALRVAQLLDGEARWLERERERERQRPAREARQRQRDQELQLSCQQEAVDALVLMELHVPFTAADVHASYRQAARDCHPDTGGSNKMMQRLNAERSQLMQLVV